MIGLIHKNLFALIESAAGADAVVEVRQKAGVPRDKYFGMNDSFDDGEWRRLFSAACEVLELTEQQAEEGFAVFFYKDALTRWPVWFQTSKTAREFIERQPVIHNSLATGLRNGEDRQSVNDKFKVESRGDTLVVHYCSPNHHCGLYKALARKIMEHYGDKAQIRELSCMKEGARECEIHIEWM